MGCNEMCGQKEIFDGLDILALAGLCGGGKL
jgi:hypothetical protein